MITIGSLFSGIGGLEIGLERGLAQADIHATTLFQVEQNEYARRVLAKHWPGALRFEDVRAVGADLPPVDLICGGFPCQDISHAGKQAGITENTRSGLFYELARIVGLVRPRYLVLENVSAITTSNGGADLGAVLGELASLGYDGWWDCVPASAVGAPHRRDRWFFVGWQGVDLGDPSEARPKAARGLEQLRSMPAAGGLTVADTSGGRVQSHRGSELMAGAPSSRQGDHRERQRVWDTSRGCGETLQRGREAVRSALHNRGWAYSQPRLGGAPDGISRGLDGRLMWPTATKSTGAQTADNPTPGQTGGTSLRGAAEMQPDRPWQPWEGSTPRTAHQTATTKERLAALGNAVVPQVAEVIGLFLAEIIRSGK